MKLFFLESLNHMKRVQIYYLKKINMTCDIVGHVLMVFL